MINITLIRELIVTFSLLWSYFSSGAEDNPNKQDAGSLFPWSYFSSGAEDNPNKQDAVSLFLLRLGQRKVKCLL